MRYDQKQIGRQLNIVSQLQYNDTKKWNILSSSNVKIQQQLSEWRTSSYPVLNKKKTQLPQLTTTNNFHQNQYQLRDTNSQIFQQYNFVRNHIIDPISVLPIPRQTRYQKNTQISIEPKPILLSLPTMIRSKQKNPLINHLPNPNYQNSKRMTYSQYLKKLEKKQNLSYQQQHPGQILLKLNIVEKQQKYGRFKGSIRKRNRILIRQRSQQRIQFKECIKSSRSQKP